MWVFVVKYFLFQRSACCLPPSVVVRSVLQGLGDAWSGKGEGLGKMGPNIRGEDGGHGGVYI